MKKNHSLKSVIKTKQNSKKIIHFYSLSNGRCRWLEKPWLLHGIGCFYSYSGWIFYSFPIHSPLVGCLVLALQKLPSELIRIKIFIYQVLNFFPSRTFFFDYNIYKKMAYEWSTCQYYGVAIGIFLLIVGGTMYLAYDQDWFNTVAKLFD